MVSYNYYTIIILSMYTLYCRNYQRFVICLQVTVQVTNLPMIDTECIFTTGEVVTTLPTQVSQDRSAVTCTLTTSSLPISLFTNNGMDCLHTVEPVYYVHLGSNKKCPDFQGVLIFQVILYEEVPFGTSAKYLDYTGVHIFKCPHKQVSL